MADETTSAPSSAGGGGNKLTRFIRKNKALSAVLGVVGVYVLFKETRRGASSEEESMTEGESQSSSALPREANDETHQALDEEIHRVEEESNENNRAREEEIQERENRGEEGGSKETPEGNIEPSTPANEAPTTDTASGGLSIHGRLFAGATNSHISGSGQTDGGKKYIEYTITFPGRQEHWQYFTATGNWRQVKNSAAGPGANKPPTGGNKNPTPTGGGNESQGGGNTAPPQNNANHPDAINTGNRCVNGGVGGHTAPKGYHLFCENGWIWRAPDRVAVGPGIPVAGPAPAPAPAPSAPPPNHGDPAHPNAVPTGNACVNGGIGKHTAPAGYHLYCGPGNQIFRAPN